MPTDSGLSAEADELVHRLRNLLNQHDLRLHLLEQGKLPDVAEAVQKIGELKQEIVEGTRALLVALKPGRLPRQK